MTIGERRPPLHSAVLVANQAARENLGWKISCFAPLRVWLDSYCCLPKLDDRAREDRKALVGEGEGVEVEEETEIANTHSHMHYLDGIDRTCLMDELYKMKIECVDFYLPQLVYASLEKDNSAQLERFLLRECSEWMGLAVKAHWLYQAIVSDGVSITGKHMHDEAGRMMVGCEEAVLAGDKPLRDSPTSNFVARGKIRSARSQTDLGYVGRPEVEDTSLRGRSDGAINVRLPGSGTSPPPPPDAGMSTEFVVRSRGALERLRVLSRRTRNLVINKLGHVNSVYSDLGDPLVGVEAVLKEVGGNDDGVVLEKNLRWDYWKIQNSFVKLLTGMACSLAAIEERNFELKSSLALLNEWLFERRVGVALVTGLYRLTGVSLPKGMPGCASRRDNVRGHIVKIHDSRVFKTHTRAPFMVVVEVVDLEELGGGDVASGYIMEELGIEPGSKERWSGALRTELCEVVEGMGAEKWGGMFFGEVFEEKEKIETRGGGMNLRKGFKTLAKKCAKEHRPTHAEIRRSIWGEPFEMRKKKLRENSVYGKLRSWNCVEVMVKGGDDVRQEVLAGQLVRILQQIFAEGQLPLWLKPYETVAVDSECGLMEMLVDTVSLDGLKKEYPGENLWGIFKLAFGDSKDTLGRARKNFIESLAAYSLFSYFLAVRDRHNGNLLLDRRGHLIDIDFGFMLSSAPGNIAFENAPFKLTQEYIEVIGGEDSDDFEYFRTLVIRGFLEARKHRDRLVLPVKMLADSGCSMECLVRKGGPRQTVKEMEERFYGELSEEACIQKIVELIDNSVDNWRTIQYDEFQRITNGIM